MGTMNTFLFQALWLAIYWYYMEQAGSMEKGAGKRCVGFGLTAFCLILAFRIPLWCSWLMVSSVMILYDLFFDREPFRNQWRRVLTPGICLTAGSLMPQRYFFVFHGLILLLYFLLLSKKRESLHVGNGILTGACFLLVSGFLWFAGCPEGLQIGEPIKSIILWGGAALELIIFLAVEGTLFTYKKGFEFRTEQFREELMEHSYGEIMGIYMDMRGWRHDYHNHMQVMKAQLAMGNFDEMESYLDQLEKELDRVDTLVKSGNLMADAILNSKLTLARRHNISINCKAVLTKHLSVEDVDLCIILGNLLDNAIEACEQVEEDARFLRIYMTVNKNQLYLSVQNAAREEPGFDARNYITGKRGNHGLGMKRVKAAVDKYNGYLNLANEPGIFAAEVTLPLAESSLSTDKPDTLPEATLSGDVASTDIS